jgi:diaminopimelate epimerase
MLLEFTKMNGAGNDFILVDNRDRKIQLTRAQVAQLCHRQRGAGADGLILLVPCASGRADWAWDFYNSDGSSAEMCGNGSRCFARFVQKLTSCANTLSFETTAGVISARIIGERVAVNLTSPTNLQLNLKVPMSCGTQTVHSINTGVPHAVLLVEDADKAPVQSWGSELRFHPQFKPKGTNVNFVQVTGPGAIRVRTYERGVEGETLACGTGVTASALIAARVHDFPSPVRVRVQGGDTLEVSFKQRNGAFEEVCLTGPADFVFKGQIEIGLAN